MNSRFQIGEKISDYRITGFLGQGGMGEVYHAVHETLNRPVAVKVVGGISGMKQNLRTRFFNEARLQASLHHPNIATLYDFQQSGEQLFIFMEFVDGDCLNDLIEQRFFSVEETLQVFESIVGAIAFVHAHGIVHRDIKAQNIKLTANGLPKLLDFGIAKDAASHSLTGTGGVIGTPNYLAPEQFAGQPASPQTDIWALGILLYKMLTGNLPFDADNLGSLQMQIRSGKFTAPDALNPAVPRPVARIVERCLEKEPTRRYRTAEELLLDTRDILTRHYGAAAISASYLPKIAEFSGAGDFRGASRKKSLVPAAIGAASAVLILFAFLGLGFWAMTGADKTTNEIANKTNQPSNRDIIVTGKNKPLPVSQTEAVKPKRKTIQVDAFGGQAQVVRDGQIIGTTPLAVQGADGETIALTLRREGYKDKDVKIEITGGKKVYTFSLDSK